MDLATDSGLDLVIRPQGRPLSFPLAVAALDLLAGLAAVLLSGAQLWGLGLVAVGMFAQAQHGAYRERLSLRALDTLPASLKALALAGLTTLIAMQVTVGSAMLADGQRTVLLALLIWAALLPLARTISYRIIKALRISGRQARPTLVVGMSRDSAGLVRSLTHHKAYGLRPLGHVGPIPAVPCDDVPYLGRTQDLAELIMLDAIASVVIDATSLEPKEVLQAVEVCQKLDVEIFVVPAAGEVLSSRTLERVQAVSLFRLPRRPFRSIQWRVKRLLDIVVSATALVVLAPSLALAAFLITRETRAGVLFRQRRVGLDGKSFDVLKLQTMVPATQTESQTQWNIANDSRLGPIGRFFRRTSIDELPQLINVLRGDMSLVGPRPERPHFVEQFSEQYPRYMARHRVPCGLTGFAQVEGLRGDTSIPERIAFDNLYIEQWSLWLDCKILLRTFPAVLRGEGG